jgi:ABC-type Fe3+-hydroxamate transport system substrate-binding protein
MKRIKKAATELEGALTERKLRIVALKEEMAEAKKQLKATREEARQRVVAFIERNPGASYEMAAERCGVSGPQAFHYLKKAGFVCVCQWVGSANKEAK